MRDNEFFADSIGNNSNTRTLVANVSDDEDGTESSTTGTTTTSSSVGIDDVEDETQDEDTYDNYYYEKLRQEALNVEKQEPELSILLRRTILRDDVHSFEEAVAATVCYRLLSAEVPTTTTRRNEQKQETKSMYCPSALRSLFDKCMIIEQGDDDDDDENDNVASLFLEHGSTMRTAIRRDAMAVIERDPAVNTLLEVVLFSKGYASLVCHRVAHRLWLSMKRKYTALFLQSQTSAVFGLDVHPLTVIGTGIMFDHGTGVVTGETARIGNNCTILHGVTLGGTGKDSGDRHPKVGDNVMIGAGTSILGNIHIGSNSKIGAGSVVLRTIPPYTTAVGAPAKIVNSGGGNGKNNINKEEEEKRINVDIFLRDVKLLNQSKSCSSSSSGTARTTSSATLALSDDDDEEEETTARSTMSSSLSSIPFITC